MSGRKNLKHTVTCYVRADPDSSVRGVLEEVWKHLNLKMEEQHNTTVLLQNENEKWRDADAITLILCPVSSRLASNAKHAMKGIRGHKNMALVFLHHVASHVPFDCPSESVLMDAEFTSLGAMVDVVFCRGQGVYDSPANTRAINKFCEFLKDTSPIKEHVSAGNQGNGSTPVYSHHPNTEESTTENNPLTGSQNQSGTDTDNASLDNLFRIITNPNPDPNLLLIEMGKLIVSGIVTSKDNNRNL